MKTTRAFIGVLTLGLLAVPGGIAEAGLVGHWGFDSVVGGITPNSGSGGTPMDGNVMGDALLEADVTDGVITRASAMVFDGDGDQVVVNDGVADLHSAAPFTITAWIKTTASGQAILGKDDGTFAPGSKHFFVDSVGIPLGYVGHSQEWIQTTSPVNDGSWHNVAVSDNPGQWQRVYVDGINVTTANNFFGDVDLGQIVRIGSSTWADAGYFAGHIDDVYIFERPLDDDEMAELFSAPTVETPLEFHNTNLQINADAELQLNTYADATMGDLTVLPDVTLTVKQAPALPVADLRLGDGSRLEGNVGVRGALSPGGVGETAAATIRGVLEFGEEASYRCDIGRWDSPGGLPPVPPLPDPPMDLSINDRVHVSGGDIYLDGELGRCPHRHHRVEPGPYRPRRVPHPE